MENNHTAKMQTVRRDMVFRVHRGLQRSAPPVAIALFYGLGTLDFVPNLGWDPLAESFDHHVIGMAYSTVAATL